MVEIQETGRGGNQSYTLKRARDTHGGSHFFSVCSLIEMFHPTSSILLHMTKHGNNYHIRRDANGAYNFRTSFEFVFILNLLKETLWITNVFCQALQQQSQDIVNAIQLVATTKALIQKLREEGWDSLLNEVKLLCQHHHIDVPNFNAQYTTRRSRGQGQQGIIVEHFYRVEIFLVAIDKKLQELKHGV